MFYFKEPWASIGNTPLIRIASQLYAKLETVNPTGSIKDRPIKYILEKAIKDNTVTKDTILVEATSGNTGISLSALGASLGLRVKIIMPKNMSVERKQMMMLFGAEIIEVGHSDFQGAINARNEMVKQWDHWSPMQFENNLNIECHKNTTADEILKQVPQQTDISAFFSGVGTGGTIMGVREALVENGGNPYICMVKPAEPSNDHGIQGIGDGEDYLADTSLFDEIIAIKTNDAKKKAKDFARQRGVLVGISSGANILAAENYIKTNNPGGIVVTIICDRGERYLSEFK
jgi:cysteine synthase A